MKKVKFSDLTGGDKFMVHQPGEAPNMTVDKIYMVLDSDVVYADEVDATFPDSYNSVRLVSGSLYTYPDDAEVWALNQS